MVFDLWFDIFCIPAASNHAAAEIRRKVIDSISQIFAGADAVLVLDKALMKLTIDRLSLAEIMARIASPGWMTRCWTFSEAPLASNSTILFCIGNMIVRYRGRSFWSGNGKVYEHPTVPSAAMCRDIHRAAFGPFHVACKLQSWVLMGQHYFEPHGVHWHIAQ
jgi:hypothetical protein